MLTGNKNLLILAFAFCLLPWNSWGQKTQVDSLHELLKKSSGDTMRLHLLEELSDAEVILNPSHALEHVMEAIPLAQKLKIPLSEAKGYYHQAVCYYYTGKMDSARILISRALEMNRTIRDRTLDTEGYSLRGSVYTELSQFDQALSDHLSSLKYAEEDNNLSAMAQSYNNLGSVYYQLSEPEKSTSFFRKALNVYFEIPDSLPAATVLNNMSLMAQSSDSTLYFLTLANRIFKQYNHKTGIAYTAMNIGSQYAKNEDYDRGLPYIQEALELFSSPDLNFTPGMISGYINMGAIKGYTGNLREAREWFKQAIDLAKETQHVNYLKDTYEEMVRVYEEQGVPDSALVFMKKYAEIKDTLYNKTRASEIAESEVKYETEVKDRELAENRLIIARQQANQQIYLLVGIASLLLLTSLFFYFRNRQNERRRKAEMALQLERVESEKLRDLDKMKSSFFANISHELRTPITLMLSPIDRLRGHNLSQKEKYLDIMQRSGEKLLNLVNQLLDLSKFEDKKMKLTVQETDLSTLLKRLAYSFESMADNRHIEYEVRVDQNLGAGFLDVDKLEKVVINLLSNAFKYTEPGDQISITATNNNKILDLEIRDTGVGIPKDKITNIFNRFYQVEGTEKYGTGIGLALVKECVEIHRGTIRVDSMEGQHTTFTISVPTSRGAYKEHEISEEETISMVLPLADQSTTTKPVQMITESDIMDKKLILIVEDQPDLQFYLSEMLDSTYRFVVAQDGLDGMEKALQYIPDLILSDIMMPNLDGYGLLQQLKQDERTDHIPVILLTAKSDLAAKLEGLEFGADDYLTKPFSEAELMARISNLLKTRENLQAKFKQNGIFQFPESSGELTMEERFLKSVVKQIEQQYDDDLFGVEALSRAMNMSRSQLHRKLKSIADVTPTEMIRNYRLNKAKQLLLSKTKTVSDVAFDVGYKTVAHFSDSFKKHFGQTPTSLIH